jgi:hypothetical protein
MRASTLDDFPSPAIAHAMPEPVRPDFTYIRWLKSAFHVMNLVVKRGLIHGNYRYSRTFPAAKERFVMEEPPFVKEGLWMEAS